MIDKRNDIGLNHKDCIVALASPWGSSAIAVIRISGLNAHRLLLSCIDWSTEYKPKPNYLYLKKFLHPNNKKFIDQVLVSFFYAPHSYTGEDSVEIFCHGGIYIIKEILSILYNLGIREANPGEFTYRAYLNGKLDLIQAEGINQLINAVSEQQFIAGQQLFNGKLSFIVNKLKNNIVDVLSYLNAQIDFPEEEAVIEYGNMYIKIKNILVETLSIIRQLISTYDSGRIAKDGLKVAIIGPTNVGKSTLMNTLLGEDRAIVSSIAGTTRDYIEESLLLKGRLIKLIDTAGLRVTVNDPIEKEGIELTKKLADKADLILLVSSRDVDISYSVFKEIKATFSNCKKIISVLNKKDLFNDSCDSIEEFDVCISCKNDEGIDELKQKIIDYIDNQLFVLKDNSQVLISSLRHFQDLMNAKKYIVNAITLLEDEKISDELIAFELNQCVYALKSIIGELSSGDILNKIFSEFCIGK